MTKSMQQQGTTSTTTTPSTSRFGGSSRPKSSRLFQQTKSSSPTTTESQTRPAESSTKSEFTLRDAISPVSSYSTTATTTPTASTTMGRHGKDLLADISFDDSRNLSVYESVSTSANSSFDVVHGSPTRYPQSRHVSFDGSNVSDYLPDTPEKGNFNHNNTHSRGMVTPDRIVSMSPIILDNEHRGSKNNKSPASVLRNGSVSTTASIDDESAATVPTSNQQVMVVIKSSSPPVHPTSSMDETSVSSSVSYDEFGVARNAYETSTSFVAEPSLNTTTTASTSTNPFGNDAKKSETKEPTPSIVTTPTLIATGANPFEVESTNPFDATDGSASTQLPVFSVRTKSSRTSPPVLSSISEQSNVPKENGSSILSSVVRDTAVVEPKKASWMTFLRPLDNPSPNEELEDSKAVTTVATTAAPVRWKPSKPFEMVNMYQDPNEITPVLFMVESKRQCWFHNEMDTIRREWQYYKKLIRDNVQEVIRVEDMLKSSYDGLVNYVKNIDDMIADLYVNESGELLNKRDKAKIMKRRSDAGATDDSNNNDGDDDDDDANYLNLWLTPMIESFSTVQGEIKTQLPFLEECLLDVIRLKQEMRSRGKELDEKGNTLSLRIMEQAESNIQDSFDALMRVIDELERTKREERKAAKASNATPCSNNSSDGVLRAFVDETKTEDVPNPINDRWLYESQYRYCAKLGLLSWKENRKDYEFWYAEVIALHEERKCRLNEVLLSFLPRRKDLFIATHKALMTGSDALDEAKSSSRKEAQAIDNAIERNAVTAMKNDPTKHAGLTVEAILNPKLKSASSGAPTKYARSSTDLWKSALIRERRLVELKVTKDEWKIAVCIVTLDDCMHVFIMSDDLLNDMTTTTSAAQQTTTNPFESSTTSGADASTTSKTLDYYTKKMSTIVTTRIPPIEYSIKLVDYDITIVGGMDETTCKNPFGSSSSSPSNSVPAELELVRRSRSMIFRKRDDYITIRVPSKKDAIKFLRNRLPVGERLAEI